MDDSSPRGGRDLTMDVGPVAEPPLHFRAALDRLQRGNRRFASKSGRGGLASLRRREALVAGQSPFAVILSCSDSRVPAELVFDCGLGELFVVRVAGNVVVPALVGSVEFAVSTFGTQLVVVMGHTNCGAVTAALQMCDGHPPSSPNVAELVDRIAPAIRSVSRSKHRPLRDILPDAIRANVRASADALLRESEILRTRTDAGELMVVAAEYALETGEVVFLNGEA
jgi:carbonic anhydrase